MNELELIRLILEGKEPDPKKILDKVKKDVGASDSKDDKKPSKKGDKDDSPSEADDEMDPDSDENKQFGGDDSKDDKEPKKKPKLDMSKDHPSKGGDKKSSEKPDSSDDGDSPVADDEPVEGSDDKKAPKDPDGGDDSKDNSPEGEEKSDDSGDSEDSGDPDKEDGDSDSTEGGETPGEVVTGNTKSKVNLTPKIKDEEISEERIGFKALKNKLAHEKGVKNPGGLAYAIGKKKYGKKGMEQKAEANESLNEESMHHVRMFKYHDQMARVAAKALKKGGNKELQRQYEFHCKRCKHHEERIYDPSIRDDRS